MPPGIHESTRATDCQIPESAAGCGRADLDALVRALAAGDAAALSSLYEQTVMQSFAIAVAILKCREDAEEVVCDLFRHVWQSADTYDPARGSVMAWLAVIVRHRAIDRLRQRRQLLSLDDERQAELVRSLAGEAPGPEQLLAKFQAGSAVHRALSALTPQRRHLLGLAFFQGLSHREIADAVGLPLGTVKSHVRRALASLKDHLAVDA